MVVPSPRQVPPASPSGGRALGAGQAELVLDVGPVRLRLRTDPPGRDGRPAGAAGLLGGYRPGGAAPSLTVGASLTRDTRPAPSRERHLARFRWAGGDRYEDRCELWTAHLGGFTPPPAGLSPAPDAGGETSDRGPMGAGGTVQPWARALVSSRATDPVLWTRAAVLLARVAVASALPLRGGVLLHGCAMVPPGGGAATLFTGASGQGKTTMTRRLPGWRVLADDTVAVWAASPRGASRGPGAFRVAGTPFAGKERLPRDGRPVPLGRVVLLAPGAPRAALVGVSGGAAFRALTARVMCFADRGPLVERTWEVTAALAEAVPVQRLSSSLEHDVSALLGARHAGQA